MTNYVKYMILEQAKKFHKQENEILEKEYLKTLIRLNCRPSQLSVGITSDLNIKYIFHRENEEDEWNKIQTIKFNFETYEVETINGK